MIIDAHVHLYREWAGTKGMSAGELIEHLARNGIEKAVVFTLEGFLKRNYRKSNDELWAEVKDFPEILYPFCTVSPFDGQEALDEMRRAVEELGMRGLKIHPWVQAFSVACDYMFPLVEETIRLGIPIHTHDGSPPYTQPLQIAYLAELYPEATIILGHSGIRDLWKNALSAAKNYKNIWLCTCNANPLGLETMVAEVGADRIIFGSDAGWGAPALITCELMKVKELNIREEDKEKILGENVMRLLGI